VNSEELYHYGIKGQKWGRRRYQNEDGSLTSAGKQRYGASEDALRATKKLVDGGKDLNRAGKELANERSRKNQKKADKELEVAVRDQARKMTDQELREAVNRLNMEENYTRMMQNRERIDLGESKASKFMDRSMAALTLTSTALSIALAIKELKK
jgi:hypothetical protein